MAISTQIKVLRVHSNGVLDYDFISYQLGEEKKIQVSINLPSTRSTRQDIAHTKDRFQNPLSQSRGEKN